MANWARVDRKFWSHPKVLAAGNSAIGLWIRANSWCRDHRTAGIIPREEALKFGSLDELETLVSVGLWEVGEDSLRFKDWSFWNPDETPKTTAARIVLEIISDDYPSSVRQQLVAKVSELLEQGHDLRHLRAALRLWLTKPGYGAGILPTLVSDAIRRQSDTPLIDALRDAYKTGDMEPLNKFHLTYVPPDIPREVRGVQNVQRFIEKHKREWIKEVQESLR